ncbi:MAG: hypothetical protein GWN87_27385 [Desulfuromonadales bacterium]|nr:hypothetical protein [Desulfuromonadales bacterium]NIS43445.1 hypothetical protein [Desulfuromonadales bacterium]
MENAHRLEARAATDHFQSRLDILRVAQAHGVENGTLDGLQQQLGTLPGRSDQVKLLAPDMEEREGAEAYRQQQDIQNDDAGDQALKKQRTSKNRV